MKMYYLYKFINKDNNVIYVGQTENLKKRIASHRAEKIWFNEIIKIEYHICKSKIDVDIYELYYINKYKSKYNSELLYRDNCSFELVDLCFIEYDMNNIKARVDAFCTHRNSALELNHKSNKDILDFYSENVMNYKDWSNILYNKRFNINGESYIYKGVLIENDNFSLSFKHENVDNGLMNYTLTQFLSKLVKYKIVLY